MTSTANSIKQRKLSDLRVIDLQRELRSFNISFDKKELKGVLIEKLRQALVSRNLDPDNYLFDTSTDLKSISSDENNRNLEENGSNELNTSEILTMETESDQQFNPDYSEQTNSPRSSTQSEGDNESTEQQINRSDSRTNNNNNDDDDDGNIFLTIDQSTTKQDEDENNNHNDTIERDFTEQYQTSNDNFDNNSQSNDINQTFDDNSTDQQHVLQTTNLSTDNDNLSKSENDQTKSRNINKDQCHLWVSNIAKETHASHLKDLFSKHGKVLTTKVIGSSSSRWFGYINLATPDDVEKCINALHQTELHGKKIYVDREMHEEPSPAKKRDSSRDREKKSSNTDEINSSKKRSASSSSNDNRKKISSSDANETTHKKSSDSNNEIRPSSSRSSDRPKMSISSTHRSRSRERSDRYRSSSIDQSKKYDKPKDTTHRSHYDKNVQERKQFVQHQEEKIKEEQRRLADERERMRREYELLERERQNIERTRAALQKEKQDQAREIEKQRRLADEAKHRHEIEDKIRDEKLQRLAQSDSKRSHSSHRDSQRSSHHSNSTNNNNNNSNKGYDHRSSSSNNERNRDYYSESKRPYTDNSNNQRDPIFRDRPNYRDSGPSSSNFGLSSSSSNNNNNQRYMSSSSSNQHRPSDPFSTLSSRGRDMALPPASSVSSAYDRSSRNASSSTTNPNAMSRRPHSRERFDNREYLQQAQRRERSPIPSSSTLRREPIEPSHWDRSKSRDAPRYNDDTHKYLPSQYLSDSSQSSQQQQQQQGLWSAAPPSRQSSHHHSDLPGKTGSHVPIVDPYNWQCVSQQGPPQSHHPSNDRSRNNIPSNQRMPILQSSQPPPLPPPPSSRGSASGQTHLYSHPGVPLNTLPTSQQHTSLTAPSLRHPTTYLTQQTSPTGLVLHPTGQTRPYEQHYVVTPSLSQRRF